MVGQEVTVMMPVENFNAFSNAGAVKGSSQQTWEEGAKIRVEKPMVVREGVILGTHVTRVSD